MAEKEGHDAAFIHTKENVFYLTDFYTDPHERLMGLFLFQEQEPFSFVREWKPDKPARRVGAWYYRLRRSRRSVGADQSRAHKTKCAA
ncbi:aminopeptidase P family N-terminal domain-containing protein [Bacillus velezensis]|nr:aminopeptidase P family N-terminal domain-containing protein [Bacillus velezensis]